MSNKCIVSLGTKNSRYVDGLARLSNSLRDNAAGIDFLGFIHEKSVGAPLHTENNYAFKVYAIQKAIDAGYTQILWLDCSVWAVAPVHHIFRLIQRKGHWFEGAGCWLGDWCNDQTLKFYDREREYAKTIPMCQSGFMGFNMEDSVSFGLWRSLKHAMESDLFNGSWADHRHDQSCMSMILHLAGISFSHLPEYIQYSGEKEEIINEKIIFKCCGL